MLQVRVVTRETDVDMGITELDLGSTDTQIIGAVERRLESKLTGHMVTRDEDRVLVNPSPVFG